MNAAPPSVRPSNALRTRIATALLSVGRRLAPDDRDDDGLASPAVVFAPHPDDEVLGCGGTIALKVAAGADVTVVIMTDGRASHATRIVSERLIRMRRAEAQQAAQKLGLPAENYVFLDFEDHRLTERAPAARQRVLALLERLRPQQVFVPHRRDGLADHVATYSIVSDALRSLHRRATLLEYPVWLWNSWPWTTNVRRSGSLAAAAGQLPVDIAAIVFGCRTRIDVRPVLQQKRDALAMYASQMQRLNNDPNWPILADVGAGDFLACFLSGIEIFRPSRVGR